MWRKRQREAGLIRLLFSEHKALTGNSEQHTTRDTHKDDEYNYTLLYVEIIYTHRTLAPVTNCISTLTHAMYIRVTRGSVNVHRW
jgi:hypothetical protein